MDGRTSVLTCFFSHRNRGRSRYSWLSRQHADLKRIQAFACVAVAELRQVPAGVVVDLNAVVAESAVSVGQGPVDQLLELPNGERFKLENLRARDEWAVDIEKRIVSRCADQPEISAFHIGQ